VFILRSLRAKLLILFVSLLLVPVIGVGLYGQFFLSNTFQQQSIELEQQHLTSHAAQVREIFIETQNNLIFLMETRALQFLANSPPDSELYQASFQVLRNDLAIFARTHPIYQHIAYYNEVGQRIVSVEAVDGGILVHDPQSPDMFAVFVRQVLRSPTGTTHLGVDEQSDGSTQSTVFAFRSTDGVVLASLWTQQLFHLDMEDNASGTWSLRLPIQTILHFTEPGQERLSPAMDAHDDWLRKPSGYYQTNQTHVFYQNISVPTMQDQYNLTLFHTLPSQQLQPDLSQFYQTFASLVLGGVLCVIALSLFSIDRFVEPVRFLKNSMDEMRRTGKTPSIPKQLPPDEIGELSLAFYTMGLELETRRESERALVEKLITAQEEERKRIAYDLHDGLIQDLVGARFYLNQSKTLLVDRFTDPAYEKLFNAGYESLSGAIVEGRRIMQGLHPSILDDLGLVEAITELSQNAAHQSNWEIELQLATLQQEPDKITNVTLYRIAQEALSNACKHAKAQHVQVKLWQNGGLHLVVADDGIGFDPDNPPQSESGWGLRTMQERINLLHGSINIHSQPGKGTALSIWIPQKTNSVHGGKHGNSN